MAPVVDLMAALKESLAKTEKKGGVAARKGPQRVTPVKANKKRPRSAA